MENKNLIVISFDGLSSLDFEYISNLPNFREFLKNSSFCKNVNTIYPSLTYPAHASIVTGKYPKNHKVINNTILDINRKNPDWYWYSKYIKGDSLFTLADKKGFKVASILWPVTAGAKIKYNMPEIFSNRKWTNQAIVSGLNGSLIYQLDLERKFSHLRDGIKEPNLGDFVEKSIIYTLKKYKPDFLFAHIIDLDTNRHKYGFNSEEAKNALKRHDEKLGNIMKVLKSLDFYKNSTIVLLGDHSSIDVDKVIFLNSIFYKNGYINIQKKKIKDYKVIAKSCDGSSYIYIKDKSIKKEIEKILKNLELDESSGIEKVFDNNNIKSLGADSEADFIIEAKCGYYFLDDIRNYSILDLNTLGEYERKLYLKNCHGYLPSKKDYKTVFMISGDNIRKNHIIENMDLIDIAPTISYLFNLGLSEYDGEVKNEIIK